MKILILAPPRSGSSTLQAAVSEAHNLKWITEPFNEELQESWDGNQSVESVYPFKSNPHQIPDGYVIKCLTFFNHWPDTFARYWAEGIDKYMKVYDRFEYQEAKLEFFLNYSNHFDKVILLLRRDVGDQLRSMVIGMQKEEKAGRRLFSHWNGAYEGFEPVLDDSAVLNTRLLFNSIKIIESISKIKHLPIVYYEDLFAEERVFMRTTKVYDLGLENMWSKHFDPAKRWRKSGSSNQTQNDNKP